MLHVAVKKTKAKLRQDSALVRLLRTAVEQAAGDDDGRDLDAVQIGDAEGVAFEDSRVCLECYWFRNPLRREDGDCRRELEGGRHHPEEGQGHCETDEDEQRVGSHGSGNANGTDGRESHRFDYLPR